MPEFTTRLARCAKAADMTTSDLARWFERPRATVSTWLAGRTPWGPQQRLAFERLGLLEDSIARRKEHYPVPANLTWTAREKYVRGMLDDARGHGRVPKMRSAG